MINRCKFDEYYLLWTKLLNFSGWRMIFSFFLWNQQNLDKNRGRFQTCPKRVFLLKIEGDFIIL